MRITLTSIQPPHTDNIFTGKKTIEWRKRELPTGEHHIYETKKNSGAGLVIGTVRVLRHYYFNSIDEIPDYLIEEGCVTRNYLKLYAGKNEIYANILFDPIKFETPKQLNEYYSAKTGEKINLPPQSYMYAILKEN